MLATFSQSVYHYHPCQYANGHFQKAQRALMDSSQSILYRITSAALEAILASSYLLIEALVFIPGKWVYTCFFSKEPSTTSALTAPSPNTPSVFVAIQNENPIIQRPATDVIIPQLTFGDGFATTVSEPWGFSPMELSGGVIFTMDIQSRYPDGSVPGYFNIDRELIDFQRRNGITFPLHLSPEHPVNLSEEALRAAGIPTNAKAFQFMYPGALKIKFDNPRENTPANKARIIGLIKDQLRLPLQQLLLVGAFLYFSDRDWPPGGGTRGIAGINVLTPGGNPSDGNRKQLYFGQAKIVSQPIIDQLRHWADLTDRYYSEGSPPTIRDYPAMCPITVGPFRDKKFTHFEWLEPDNELIQSMCRELHDPNFGKAGVFVYFSRENPALSCMLPVTGPNEWRALMRNTAYLQIDQPEGTPSVHAFTADSCIVCFDPEQTIDKLVRLHPCNHMQICRPCAQHIQQTTNKCPTCRTPIENIDQPNLQAAVAYRPYTELGAFRLPLKAVSLTQLNPLNFLIEKECFASPKTIVPAPLRQALGLSQDITHVKFLYPLYGKGLDSTCSYLNIVKEAIASDSQHAKTLEGLVAAGGFIFYNSRGDVQSLYAILPPNSPVRADATLPLTPQPATTDTISAELTKLKDPTQENYNLCRTTLQSLLPFAKYFQWKDNRFVYSTGNGASWQASL